MAQAIIKLTHQEVVVKVWGASGITEAIDLQSSTLRATGQALDGATQTVTITGVSWTGGSNAIATITRGAETIMTLQANAAGMLYFDGQSMPPDNRQATSDISVVTSGGAAMEVWLKLRKVSGYATMIEDAAYGAYDDPTRIGASTTMSGSPDKV